MAKGVKNLKARFIFWLTKKGRTFSWKSFLFEDSWEGDISKGRKIYEGTFIFFDQELSVKNPHFWKNEEVSEAFLSYIHCFEWLRDLREFPAPQARGMARRYLMDWINTQSQQWHPLVWSLEVASTRLAAWVGCFDFFGSTAGAKFLKAFRRSLAHHVRFLEKMHRLEKPARHSIEKMKGLILAKLSLGLPVGALLKDLSVYLDGAIYGDGSFKTRSPMAQMEFLRDLLDLKQALKKAGVALPSYFQMRLERLAMVLRFFRHGDGGLAVFYRGLEGTGRNIDTLLSQVGAKGPSLQALAQSGFHRMTLGKGLVIFDTGCTLGSQQLHDDRLGFEFSYGSTRLITNGTHPLAALSERHEGAPMSFLSGTILFFRTDQKVVLNDPERSVCDQHLWEMADEKSALITADWDQRLGQDRLKHERSLALVHEGRELRGQEKVEGPEGGAALLRFTFHPKLKAQFRKDNNQVFLTTPEGQVWSFRADRLGEMSLYRGYYYGQDNQELFCPQVVMKIRFVDKAVTLKWTLKLLDALP